MNHLVLNSPAKVNLSLEVLGKRTDGYHDLRTVMVTVSLYDEITLTLKDAGIELSCDNPSVPDGEKNIAWRAARNFIEAKGVKTGLRIDLKKRIPMGGGVGGGSSNAATVLMGLNELTGNTASREELMEMGLKLGADVPFFIFGKPALAEGIGEKLTEIRDLPGISFVLVNPGIELPTASIYGSLNLRLTKSPENFKISRFNYSLSKVISSLRNDLEEVTFKKHPEVKEVKDVLEGSGAMGALMSGSGSTVFGIYSDLEAAKDALREIEKETVSRGWTAFLASSL